jgi:hypothetical protein
MLCSVTNDVAVDHSCLSNPSTNIHEDSYHIRLCIDELCLQPKVQQASSLYIYI